MTDWARVGFFTDEHRPFHHGPAVSLSLQILEDFDPELLVVGSDGCEFAALSNYPSAITYHGLTGVDAESFKDGILEKRDACPDARLFFITGNHDQRYEYYLLKCPELAELEQFQLWNWLRLDKLGVEYEFDEHPVQLPGKLPLQRIKSRVEITPNMTIAHGDYIRKYSGWSSKAQLLEGERMQSSVMMGHSHRGGVFLYADRRGHAMAGYECYHHQRLDMLWLKGKNPDWHWGIALLETQMEEPYHFSVELVNYVPLGDKLRARWRGKEYTSS